MRAPEKQTNTRMHDEDEDDNEEGNDHGHNKDEDEDDRSDKVKTMRMVARAARTMKSTWEGYPHYITTSLPTCALCRLP